LDILSATLHFYQNIINKSNLTTSNIYLNNYFRKAERHFSHNSLSIFFPSIKDLSNFPFIPRKPMLARISSGVASGIILLRLQWFLPKEWLCQNFTRLPGVSPYFFRNGAGIVIRPLVVSFENFINNFNS
jgi:hypothetical protein